MRAITIVNIFKQLTQSGDKRTKKIKYNILLSLLFRGGGILVSLLIVPLTLGYLSSYEYGVWLTISSILVWINYFDIGLGNGLRNKLAEAVADGDWEHGRIYVSTSFFILSLLMLFVTGVLFCVNKYLDWGVILNTSDHPIPNLNAVVSWILIIFCISFVLKLIGVVYMALQLPAINDLLLFAGSAFSLFLIYLLTHFTQGSLFYVAMAFSLSPLLVYLVAIPFTFKKYKSLRPGFTYIKMTYAKELMGVGFRFFIIQIACLVIFSTSNFLISHFFTPAEVTPYNIAFKYFNVVSMLFAILISPMWSAITDAYKKKEYDWIRLKMKAMVGIWGVCVALLLLMVLISGKVYTYWVGNNVSIAFSLSIGMAIYVMVSTWNQIFASFVNGITNITFQLWLSLIEAFLFIPLAYWFSHLFGLVGMVYAMTTVLFISSVGLPIQYYLIIKSK